MQLPILSEPIFRANLIASFIATDRGVKPSPCGCHVHQGGCIPTPANNHCPHGLVPQCGGAPVAIPIHWGNGHVCKCNCVLPFPQVERFPNAV
jgi:hypothetical protein